MTRPLNDDERDAILDACEQTIGEVEAMPPGKRKARASIQLHGRLRRIQNSGIEQAAKEQQQRFRQLAKRLLALF